jgi:hypothetical protein
MNCLSLTCDSYRYGTALCSSVPGVIRYSHELAEEELLSLEVWPVISMYLCIVWQEREPFLRFESKGTAFASGLNLEG